MSRRAPVGAVAADPRAEMRRRDRSKDDTWIRAVLHAAPYGFLAMVGDEGQPFLNSNIFVYDQSRHCVYLHTHRTGRTRDSLDEHDRVAFGVGAMGRLLPADTALEFSVEYASVVVFGRGSVVGDAEESRLALQALLDKYAPHLRPGRDYRNVTDDELTRTAVYRIDVEAWSGKQKEVAADFPGAYEVAPLPVPFLSRSVDAGA